MLSRNLEILRALSAGVATKGHIHVAFFRKKDGSLVSRQVLERTMKRLCKWEFIREHQYWLDPNNGRKGIVTAYYLAPAGANEVCLKCNIERGFIRLSPPAMHQFKHELIVSDTIRIIRKEADEKKIYSVGSSDGGFIFDDTEMKKRITPRKGLFYPDLYARIVPKYGKPLNLNIEVDAGTKDKRYWMDKMKSWKKDITLVITLEEARLETLYNYIVNDGGVKKAGLAIFSNFENGGLASTKWLWWPEKQYIKLGL